MVLGLQATGPKSPADHHEERSLMRRSNSEGPFECRNRKSMPLEERASGLFLG